VHVQDKGEYWQVDRIHDAAHIQTLARTASREDAYLHVDKRVPVFENGGYVTGGRLHHVASTEEFYDRGRGKWVRLAGRFHVVHGRGLAEYPEDPDNYEDGIRDAHLHHNQGYDARDDEDFGDESEGYRQGYHSTMNDISKKSVYTPDPTNDWRYSHYPPTPPLSGDGGNPAGPSDTPTGPDGFPLDLGVGEQRTPEAYARQTTPGAWTVTPGTEWRDSYLPNAATGLAPGQSPSGNPAQASRRTASAWDPADTHVPGHRPFPYNYTDAENEAYDIGVDRAGQGEPLVNIHGVPGTGIEAASPEHHMYTRGWQGERREHARPHPDMERRDFTPITSTRRTAGVESGTSDDFNGSDKPYWKCQSCGENNHSYGSQCNGCGENTGTGHELSSDHPVQRTMDRLFEGSRHTADRQSDRAQAFHEWAAENGHNPDDLGTLKLYEKQPGISRAHADEVADIYHGEDTDWRNTHRMQQTASAEDPSDWGKPGHRPFPYNYSDSENQAYEIGQDHRQAGAPYKAYEVPGIVDQSPEHQMYTRGWMGSPREHPFPQREMERRWVPGVKGDDGKFVPGTSQHVPITSTRRIAQEGVAPSGPGPNPNYFSQGTNGLAGPPTFPQDPGPEPYSNTLINDFYGTVPPQESTGSEQGTQDGQGYSRMGRRSPGFSRSAEEHVTGLADDEDDLVPDPDDPYAAGRADRHHNMGRMASFDKVDCPHCAATGLDDDDHHACPRCGGQKKLPASELENHELDTDHRPASVGGWKCDICGTPVNGQTDEDGIPVQRGDSVRHTASRRTAATNGQIVGHCDNCDKPVRWHDGKGGHLEHLHNSSHKCNDGSDARTSSLQFFDPTWVAKLASGPLAVEPVGAPPAAPANTTAATPPPPNNMPTPNQGGATTGSNGPQQPTEGISSVSSTFAAYPPHFQTTSLQTITAPTAENPTGRDPDEYKSNTWEGLINQRPMQSAEDRDINTPVKGADPIQTRNINTPTPGLDDEDEDSVRSRDEDKEED
jgi:hypothetical protein